MERPATSRELPAVSVRELRNDVSAVLRPVAQGEHLRVLRHGHDVAELVPPHRRPRWGSGESLQRILRTSTLDPGFADELREMRAERIPGPEHA